MHNLIPHGWINEYISKIQNDIQFETKFLKWLKLIVPEDIISIRVDQNFTPNAIGMLINHCNNYFKKMICNKNNHNNEHSASFVTCQFSTLTMMFGHPQALACHKNIQYQ